MAVPSLKGLMCPPNGEVNFDQITKTKTVEKLVNMVPSSCWDDLLRFLRELVMNPGVQDEKSAASRRRVIADLLLISARSRSTAVCGVTPTPSEAEQGIQQVLSLLVELAYFTPNDQPKSPGGIDNPSIAQASRDIFKAKISSCLTDMTSKSSNPSASAYHVVCVIMSRLKLSTTFTPLLEMNDTITEMIEKAWKMLRKIHSKEQSCSAETRPFLTAFKLLYSLMILQVYNGDADAVNMLDELKDSYHNLLDKNNSRTPGGPEALVDIILSLAAKPALLFRRITPHIFSACASSINEPALKSMTQV